MDLEGTEVCEWLNSIGVTAVLLKYRLPSRPDRPRSGAALDDAMRAMGMVRGRAEELGIDPNRIGMLGFSAGAHLSAAVATASAGPRTYEPIDRADAVNCRPDFIVLIYPGGFVDERNQDALWPGIVPIAGHSPPAFIAMAEDDPVRVENALQYYKGLKTAEVPVEMHLYPTGGHGYGLRQSEHLVTTWPDRVADWMKSNGWLKPAR
jgi:acetyl esterase/lipase